MKPNFFSLLIFAILFPLSLYSQAKKKTIDKTPEIKSLGFNLNNQPFDVTDNYYSKQRRFFSFFNKTNQLVILWQDVDKKQIHLTTFSNDLINQITKDLLLDTTSLLICASTDADQNIYILTSKIVGKITEMTLLKFSSTGKLITLNTFYSSGYNLDIYRIDDGLGSMICTDKNVAIFLARLMHSGHQSATILLFNKSDLQFDKSLGQTSSHSFDNLLKISSQGELLAIDIGDCYPRGINFHKLTTLGLTSRLIYTMKTQHSTSPTGGASYKPLPQYPEISDAKKKYYKWANDNNIYSSLGGIVETNECYYIFFTGEPSIANLSLDNLRAGNYKDPRNVGFLKIRKDFENSKDELNCASSEAIISQGITEKGMFYNYAGKLTQQKNIGVIWTTKYKDVQKENVRCLKSIKIDDDTIILLWEKYSLMYGASEIYEGVYSQKITNCGTSITKPKLISKELRLQVQDDLLYKEGKIYFINGINDAKKLTLSYVFTSDL